MKDTTKLERKETAGKHYYQWQKQLKAKEFINDNRKQKEQREARKISRRQEKEQKRLEKRYAGTDPFNGIITRINKNRCIVFMDGEYVECSVSVPMIKDHNKKLIDGSAKESLLAPGDRVLIENGVVKKIAQRGTTFFRKANVRDMSNKTYRQILASNIEYVAVFMPVVHPEIEWGLIDNIMLPCKKNNLKTIMVFNKCDLAKEDELEKIRARALEYDLDPSLTFFISAEKKSGTQKLIDFLKDKRTFLCGISGAGKSTFLNIVNSSFSVETGEVNEKTGRGNHTTAFSTLYPLEGNNFLIDSPGIQVFELYKVDRHEILDFVPQVEKLSHECTFSNCTHINESEEHCAVKRALASGTLSEISYKRYVNLIYRNQ